MDKNKFDAIFPIITASLTDKIMTSLNMPEDKALMQKAQQRSTRLLMLMIHCFCLS